MGPYCWILSRVICGCCTVTEKESLLPSNVADFAIKKSTEFGHVRDALPTLDDVGVYVGPLLANCMGCWR
ncbi:hypothetical protein ACLOJK_006840 [Asimina triloba]